jgi:hypothetical protein
MGGVIGPGTGVVRHLVGRVSLALVIVAGPALVVLANPVAASVVPAINVGVPSWWSGSCDAKHWDAVAADDGWSGEGAHPLGASYLGVQVCGPRPAVDGAPDVQWTRSGWPGLEWECVELAMRFMAQVYGVRSYSANGNDVVADYSQSDGGGLVKIQNGTTGEAPEPGDVISLSDGGEGHVVVVASSDVDAYGNGSITVLSQNDTTDGWRTLEVSNWWVQGFNIFTPTAWLHDPLGRGNPTAPPTVMTPPMPRAATGLQYATSLSAVGGSGPYLWSIASGRLPPGLSLDPATGVITGVPSSHWTAPFSVRVTSATGASSVKQFALVVDPSHPPLGAADFDDDLAIG